MKRKTLATLFAAAAIMISGVITYADAAPGRPGTYGRPQIMQRIISHLDLSQEQIEAIKEDLRGEKETFAPLLKQLHEARRNLRETIQDNGDEKAIRSAHAKVAAVEADMAVQRAKVRARIVPHLSEEQVEKMKVIEARLDDLTEDAIRRFGQRVGE